MKSEIGQAQEELSDYSLIFAIQGGQEKEHENRGREGPKDEGQQSLGRQLAKIKHKMDMIKINCLHACAMT